MAAGLPRNEMKISENRIFRKAVFVFFGVVFILILSFLFPATRQPTLVIAQEITSPRISGVTISELNATSAVVTWLSDKVSDSILSFSTYREYGNIRDQFYTKDHEIVVPDLDPGTTYYYRVISADQAGNRGISPDFQFTTAGLLNLKNTPSLTPEERALAEQAAYKIGQIKNPEALAAVGQKLVEVSQKNLEAPAIIGDPKIEAGPDYADFEWATDQMANSMVALIEDSQYDPGRSNSYPINQGNPDESTVDHRVRVIGLTPATLYHYQVSSQSGFGPTGKSRDNTFRTKSQLPEISHISIDKVEDVAATISWSVSVPANGLVEYTNTRTGKKGSVGNPAYLTRHTVRLNDLEFGATYSAVIRAENEAGDKLVSDPFKFTTIKDNLPPVISKVNNESTLFPGDEVKVQTIVSWKTDELATCQFKYQQGIAPGADISSSTADSSPTTDHVQVMNGLSPAMIYKFWVECDDKTMNHAKSEDFVLFTPQKEKSIIDVILENFQSTFGWVKQIGK
jgi:hypothetical protein